MGEHQLLDPLAGMSPAEYHAFLKVRPEEERWQLIDGAAFMMTPPTDTHQRIASNLARRLDEALERSRPDLATLRDIGVRIPGHETFLPVPDVVVADAVTSGTSHRDRFYLAAEVLSESNTPEFIALKVRRYAEHPDNLYTLVIAQTEMRADLWTRGSGWRGIVLRGPEAVLELPEFGFRCAVGDLYYRTAVSPV